MLRVDVVSSPVFDGMILEIDELDDQTTTCWNFEAFIDDIISCSDGTILQRLGDVVLFTIPDSKRIYGVCKQEFLTLICKDRVKLKAFTKEEYDELIETIVKSNRFNSNLIN